MIRAAGSGLKVALLSTLVGSLLLAGCGDGDGAAVEPAAQEDPEFQEAGAAAGLSTPLDGAAAVLTVNPEAVLDPETRLAPEGVAALPPEGLAVEPEGGFLAPENQLRILLFFPTAAGQGLIPEQRIIFRTDTLTSQVKQAVSELIAGPFTQGLVSAFSPGTELRGVFLPGTGLAVIDLGPQVQSIPRGSDWEQAALFSLANTVIHNFPEIHRMQILVEGQEVPTLAGHLDTSRSIRADMNRVDWVYQRLLDEAGDFERYEIGPEVPEGWVPPEPIDESAREWMLVAPDIPDIDGALDEQPSPNDSSVS